MLLSSIDLFQLSKVRWITQLEKSDALIWQLDSSSVFFPTSNWSFLLLCPSFCIWSNSINFSAPVFGSLPLCSQAVWELCVWWWPHGSAGGGRPSVRASAREDLLTRSSIWLLRSSFLQSEKLSVPCDELPDGLPLMVHVGLGGAVLQCWPSPSSLHVPCCSCTGATIFAAEACCRGAWSCWSNCVSQRIFLGFKFASQNDLVIKQKSLGL